MAWPSGPTTLIASGWAQRVWIKPVSNSSDSKRRHRSAALDCLKVSVFIAPPAVSEAPDPDLRRIILLRGRLGLMRRARSRQYPQLPAIGSAYARGGSL